MLQMKPKCENCNTETGATGIAFICSFECTFCENCTTGFGSKCPNCAGELVRRPTRLKKPLDVAASQRV